MERKQIIDELSHFFQIKELVCPHVYQKWGERAWQFLSSDFLFNLLVIRRDILKSPMSCNNSSSLTQRGLRCNLCELVHKKTTPYLSSHLLGRAGDFSIQGLSAEEARSMIIASAELLPHPLRLEGEVSWLHLDTLPQWDIDKKVYVFKV